MKYSVHGRPSATIRSKSHNKQLIAITTLSVQYQNHIKRTMSKYLEPHADTRTRICQRKHPQIKQLKHHSFSLSTTRTRGRKPEPSTKVRNQKNKQAHSMHNITHTTRRNSHSATPLRNAHLSHHTNIEHYIHKLAKIREIISISHCPTHPTPFLS